MTESPADGGSETRDASSELERLARAALGSDISDESGAPPSNLEQSIVTLAMSEKYRGAFIHPDLLRKYDEYIENARNGHSR